MKMQVKMKKKLIFILSIACAVIVAAAAVIIIFTGKTPVRTPVATPRGPVLQPPKAQVPPQVPASVPKTDNTKTAAGAPVPKEAASTYEYNSRGRRDPFATLIVKTEEEKRRGQGTIESYAVTEFKLTAVFWNESGFYGLVATPDGKNFSIRQGTVIGLHNGKVYKITKNSVIIREFEKNYRGKIVPKDTVLKLHREEEG